MNKTEFALLSLTGFMDLAEVKGETGAPDSECQSIYEEILRVRELYDNLIIKPKWEDYT